MRLEEFSKVEFQKALQRTIRALTRGKTIPYQPKAILLGGQNGAGKTSIHRIKQREFQGNIIIIDGDSYRSQHPNYLAMQKKVWQGQRRLYQGICRKNGRASS